jgi:hypothetical protein
MEQPPASSRPIDKHTAAEWTRLGIGVRGMLYAMREEGHVPPLQGSHLAIDNNAFPPRPLSEAARWRLHAALDHLLVWVNIVVPLRVQEGHFVENPPRPYFSLARGAMEAGSQAVWLLASDDSAERVERHLRLFEDDLRNLVTATSCAGGDPREAQDLIRKVTRARGASESGAPNYVDAIKMAAAATPGIEPLDAEYVWRLCSAAAHGKEWFVHRSHVLDGGGSDGATTLAHPDPAVVTRAMGLSLSITGRGMELYLKRLGSDVGAIQRGIDRAFVDWQGTR